MSGTDRDRRGRAHSDKSCPESANGGCTWCKTGDQKPSLRRAARRDGKRSTREEDRS